MGMFTGYKKTASVRSQKRSGLRVTFVFFCVPLSALNARLNIKYIDKDYPSISINNEGYSAIDFTGLSPGGTMIAATILTWDSGNINGGIALGSVGANYGYIFGNPNQTVSGLKIRFLYIDL